jgi:protein involved in polysaccharide export with SLBB domain
MPTWPLAMAAALSLQAVPFDPAVFKGSHVTVDGLVRHQGGYVVESGDTVGSVVGRAGGTTTEAPPVYVLVRTRGKQQTSCLARPTESLESGDNLIVAVKELKMPMPVQSCEVALAALRTTQ